MGRISRGRPGVIRADVPGQKLRAGPRNLGKTSIWARTSDPRGAKKLWAEKYRAGFGDWRDMSAACMDERKGAEIHVTKLHGIEINKRATGGGFIRSTDFCDFSG